MNSLCALCSLRAVGPKFTDAGSRRDTRDALSPQRGAYFLAFLRHWHRLWTGYKLKWILKE
jgi:hypothetical protein